MKTIIIFGVILILTIVTPDFFINSGIYFFLDSIFYPVYELKNFFSQSIYFHLRDSLSLLLWYKIYSKIFLLFILIIGAFLWYKIWKLINSILEIKDNKINLLLIISSILFVILNPFIYERLVTQSWIALAIFFIWLGLVYLIEYILNINNKKLYLSWFFFGISFMIMPHTAVFLLIIAIVTLSFFFKKFTIKNILISIWIFLFINANWLIWSLFLNENKTIWKISTFNTQNIESFTSNSLNWLWTEITNLLLYWFWWEKYNRLLTPDNNYWYLAWFAILIIIIYGWIELYKRKKKLTLYLLTLAIVSYILSLWISSPLFAWFNELLYTYVPYYIWMREPQKLTWLVMIVYAIFFLVWIYSILENNKNFKRKEYIKKVLLNSYSIISYMFILLIIWSPNVLFWFNGQLKISDYPDEIFQSRDNLIEFNDKDVLVLPWHSYMACEWSNRKVFSNPIWHILKPVTTIMADNIEVADLYTNSNSDRSKQIEKFVKTKDFTILKKLNIDTIYFMDKCADFPKYKYLEKSDELQKVFQSNYIKIYKINWSLFPLIRGREFKREVF